MSEFTRERIGTMYRVLEARRAGLGKLVFTDYRGEIAAWEKAA